MWMGWIIEMVVMWFLILALLGGPLCYAIAIATIGLSARGGETP